MAESALLQIAALAVAAGGTAKSIVDASAAQKSQKKADSVARAQAALENKRNIRQAINQGRVQRAQLITAGETQTGGFGGSPVQGALGSARTQEAANIGFANQTAGANASINQHLSSARSSLSSAAAFSSIAALPGQFGLDPLAKDSMIFKRNRDLRDAR